VRSTGPDPLTGEPAKEPETEAVPEVTSRLMFAIASVSQDCPELSVTSTLRAAASHAKSSVR
jgi:hypothetical protein